LVQKAGGVVIGCAFLIELADLKGAQRIAQYKTISLIKYE
jgi:adenine phosphoribosyltransferase